MNQSFSAGEGEDGSEGKNNVQFENKAVPHPNTEIRF